MNVSDSLIECSRRDLQAVGLEAKGAFSVIGHALRVPGARLLLLHRMQQGMRGKSLPSRLVSSFLWNLNYVLSGCNIGRLAVLHGGVVIPHPVAIVIGQGCIVEAGCWIYQNVTLGASHRKNSIAYPTLRQGCRIFPGACVFGDIVLAPHTTVGANAVLTMSTQEGGFYVGAPARQVAGEGDE